MMVHTCLCWSSNKVRGVGCGGVKTGGIIKPEGKQVPMNSMYTKMSLYIHKAVMGELQ